MLSSILEPLVSAHREVLLWAHKEAAALVGWPGVHPSGVRLATLAKGIYKPAGWDYALSIRQTLDSPYADEDPIFRPDGTWSYRYHQEGPGGAPTSDYTNRALNRCAADTVPIIVFRQEAVAPTVRYRVLGLALVTGWQNGFYSLEGFSPSGECAALQEIGGPVSVHDARERINRAIMARRGQPAFRATLIQAFGGSCAISGSTVLQILEAAHIVPYLGPHTNNRSNGLLLRADVHTLFDTGLIRIDPPTLRVRLFDTIRGSEYEKFHGKRLSIPDALSVGAVRANLQMREHLLIQEHA